MWRKLVEKFKDAFRWYLKKYMEVYNADFYIYNRRVY